MNTTLTPTRQKNEESRSHQRGNIPHKSSPASPTPLSITQQSENTAQSKQSAEEVPLKRSNFTMTPNFVIDNDELPDSTVLGFIRFMRRFGRSGVFVGSIRKLGKVLKMARMTVHRMVTQWETAGWIIKTSRPKQGEDGEVMCLILKQDDLWQHNSECYQKPGSNVGQDVPEESTQEQENDVGEPEESTQETVPNLDHSVPEIDQGVPNLGHDGPLLDHSVPTATLKVGGNIDSNIDSNTDSKKGGNIGQPQQKDKNTGPLPSLPPSISLNEFPFEELGNDTAHCWQALLSIGEHYFGSKVSQADAEVLAQKTQCVAQLAGPQEARRQIVSVMTFMLYSDAPSNWFRGEKRKQLTFRSVATFYDDYHRKATEANWTPPRDKVPAWFNAPTNVATAQEDTLAGMTKAEADQLASEIESQYPGMKMSFGNLPDDRFTLGLSLGGNDWLDLYNAEDWRHPPECLAKYHLKWALEAYQQYAVAGVS